MKRNVMDMPVMKSKCDTCPFKAGGWESLRPKIESRILCYASQTCHSSGSINGKRDTHLCRGARDVQLVFFHRLGVIDEPTDEAWMRAVKQLVKPHKRKT